MLVLNRKKISIIIICLILGIFSYTYQSLKMNDENIEEIKSTTSTPVSNRVIVIDAGHGKPDERS